MSFVTLHIKNQYNENIQINNASKGDLNLHYKNSPHKSMKCFYYSLVVWDKGKRGESEQII